MRISDWSSDVCSSDLRRAMASAFVPIWKGFPVMGALRRATHMTKTLTLVVLAMTTASLGLAAPAAAKAGDPIKVSDDLTIDPIIDGNLRWEHVAQDNINLDADALSSAERRVGYEFVITCRSRWSTYH